VVYVDGEPVVTQNVAGDLGNWSTDLHLGIGNDPGDARAWRGTMHLAAVYSRALSAEQVDRNFKANLD